MVRKVLGGRAERQHLEDEAFAFERLDHLDDVGGQVLVGDLDAAGDPGGTRGVLQVGDGVLEDDGVVVPRRADLIRNGVDGDDARPGVGRTAAIRPAG